MHRFDLCCFILEVVLLQPLYSVSEGNILFKNSQELLQFLATQQCIVLYISCKSDTQISVLFVLCPLQFTDFVYCLPAWFCFVWCLPVLVLLHIYSCPLLLCYYRYPTMNTKIYLLIKKNYNKEEMKTRQ